MVGTAASMALPCVSSGTLVMSVDGVGHSPASRGSNEHPVVGVGVGVGVGFEKSPVPEMRSRGLLPKTEISISGSGSNRLIRGSRRAMITLSQQPITLAPSPSSSPSPCHVAAARGGGGTVRWPSSSSAGHANRQQQQQQKKKKRPGLHAVGTTSSSSSRSSSSPCPPRVFSPSSSFDVINKNSYPFLLFPAKSGRVLVDRSLPSLSSTVARLQASRAFCPAEHHRRKDSSQSSDGFHVGSESSAEGKKTRGPRWRAEAGGKETTKKYRSDGERALGHKAAAEKKRAVVSSLCAGAEISRQPRSAIMRTTTWRHHEDDRINEAHHEWASQEERAVSKSRGQNWRELAAKPLGKERYEQHHVAQGRRLNNGERWVYSEENGGNDGLLGEGHVSLFLPLRWLPLTTSTSSASAGSAAIAAVVEEEVEEEEDDDDEEEEDEKEDWPGYGRTIDEVSSSSSSSSSSSFSSFSPCFPSPPTRYASPLSEIPLRPTSSGDLEQAYAARGGGGGGGGGGGVAFALGLGREVTNASQNRLTEAERQEKEEREEEWEVEREEDEEEEEEVETEKVLETALPVSIGSMENGGEKQWRSYLNSEFSSAVQSSPPPRQKQESALKDDYYVNVGYAIRTLREELPCLFYKEMTWGIYRNDIVFSDPFNRFQGIENYKGIFWALRFHGRIFFKVLWVDVVRIWQPFDKVIMVRWTVRGVPRVPWESQGHFDGNSEYKLDENGKIYSHKVDNVIMTAKPRPRTVIELIRIAARASSPTPTYFFRRALEFAAKIVPYVQAFSWVRFYFALRGTLAVKGQLPEAEA